MVPPNSTFPRTHSSFMSSSTFFSDLVTTLFVTFRFPLGFTELVAFSVTDKVTLLDTLADAKIELQKREDLVFYFFNLARTTLEVTCALPILNKSMEVSDVLLGTPGGISVIRDASSSKEKKVTELLPGDPVSYFQVRFDAQLLFYTFGDKGKIAYMPLSALQQKTIPSTAIQKIDSTKRTVAFRVAGKASQLFLCCVKEDEEQSKSAKARVITLSELNQKDKTGPLRPSLLHELKGLVGRSFFVRLDLFPEACVVSENGVFLVNFANSFLQPFPSDKEAKKEKAGLAFPCRIFKVDDRLLLCTRGRFLFSLHKVSTAYFVLSRCSLRIWIYFDNSGRFDPR